MRNISFSATIPQFRARQKHVSRRGNTKGPTWKNLQPGDQLMGCEKCQGLGKGGMIVRMGPITILEVSREPIDEIIRRPEREITREQFDCISSKCKFTQHGSRWCGHPGMYCTCDSDFCPCISEVALEGFPELSPAQFVDMFCEMNNCEPETEITRILFDYVEPE